MSFDDALDGSHVPYAALTANAIQNEIDSACLRANNEVADGSSGSNSGRGLVWDRSRLENQQGRSLSLLYGFYGTKDDIAQDSNKKVICTVTFYFAYSTWDGRILYIDNVMDSYKDSSITFTVYQMLVDIATQLHCRRYDPMDPVIHFAYIWIFIADDLLLSFYRLSWQHKSEETVQFPCLGGPETMHGWLTLHWDKDSMIQFISRNKYGFIDHHDTNSSITQDFPLFRSLREEVENCLLQYSFMPSICGGNCIRRLRLANSNDDIEAICRLVQGLADFEKEPDAVNVSPDH